MRNNGYQIELYLLIWKQRIFFWDQWELQQCHWNTFLTFYFFINLLIQHFKFKFAQQDEWKINMNVGMSKHLVWQWPSCALMEQEHLTKRFTWSMSLILLFDYLNIIWNISLFNLPQNITFIFKMVKTLTLEFISKIKHIFQIANNPFRLLTEHFNHRQIKLTLYAIKCNYLNFHWSCRENLGTLCVHSM